MDSPVPDDSDYNFSFPTSSILDSDDTPGDGDNNTDSNITIKSIDDLKTLLTSKKAEELTDDENAELSDIADAFGGSSFNTDGALLDADNKIIFTPEQVKAYLESGDLPVDDNGDFVNANGEVVKSKVELYRETTTVGSVMNSLAKNFGVSFKPTFMPDDSEDAVIDVVNKVVSVVNEKAVEKYFNTNPELESFRKHLLIHGSAEGYKASAIEYDKVIIKDLSKEQKKAYISEAAKAIGKPVTANYLAYLETLKEEDYNLEVAQNLTILSENQKQRRSEQDAELARKEQENTDALSAYWDTVTNTVKSGKLANINLPIPDREAFLSYLMTPVQDGKSKDMLDAENDDVNFDLLMSYLRFKNKDISQLAKNIANSEKVAGMRAKFEQNKRRNINSDKGQKPRTHDNYIPGLDEINR